MHRPAAGARGGLALSPRADGPMKLPSARAPGAESRTHEVAPSVVLVEVSRVRAGFPAFAARAAAIHLRRGSVRGDPVYHPDHLRGPGYEVPGPAPGLLRGVDL